MGESRSLKRPNPNTRSTHIKSMKKSRSSTVNVKRDRHYESGYTVDLEDLLFTPNRHFLVRNNGQRVWVDELKEKTIVLFTVPINGDLWLKPEDIFDMVQAYQHLFPLGGIEFVSVPVYINCRDVSYFKPTRFEPREDYYNHLLSTMPWPAVPFSDIESCGNSVVKTFPVEENIDYWCGFSYWVIIDPTSSVVVSREQEPFLFKSFSGAELYPLSLHRINSLCHEYGFGRYGSYNRSESRKRLIRNWDQLLASPTRDFLLSSNGDRVPISSHKGKLIGLYFCENVPCPPRMDVIKKAYQEAKLRGYDFEIVQINFHFSCFEANHSNVDMSERARYKNINWLTLPFKDPSCKKLQRIFKCSQEYNSLEHGVPDWYGDCLVIIDSRLQQANEDVISDDEVPFEFLGAEIIEKFGIEGYPFARQTLFEREYTRQKRKVKLQSYFPPGQCYFTRAIGDGGFDIVSDSQLKGKRVLVLFDDSEGMKYSTFISMLKSRYREQTEEDNFEVVYVSMDNSSESECIDMPWLVHPYSYEFGKWCYNEIFKYCTKTGAAAFDIDGQLIAKDYLDSYGDAYFGRHRFFPFFSRDLVKQISDEVKNKCHLYRHDI